MLIKLYDSLGFFVGTRDEKTIEDPYSKMTKDFFYFGGHMSINGEVISSHNVLAGMLQSDT